MKLDDKTKGLAAVAAAVGANCVPCFRWHYNNCLKMGVAAEELDEIINLADIIKSMPQKMFNENVEKIQSK
jgi:AhpD family alkylhydroperoxidase